MKTLFIGGYFHNIIQKQCGDILNQNPLMLSEVVSLLSHTPLSFEQVVVVDDGTVGSDLFHIENDLNNLQSFLDRERITCDIVFLTTNSLITSINCPGLKVIHFYTIRISLATYAETVAGRTNKIKNAIKSQLRENKTVSSHHKNATEPSLPKESPSSNEQKPKQNILSRFKQKKPIEDALTQTDDITRSFENISRSVSRTIAITGHRGSGVTSTAVNLAHIAAQRKLSTMLLDLDTVNRSINLYFSGFFEQSEKQEEITCSLIRNLAKPQECKLNSYRQNDLYVSSLAYSVRERRMLEQVFTEQKLIAMLSVFKQKFNICIIDFPLEVLKRFPQVIIHLDAIGMCASNNLYSITTTLRNSETVFDAETMGVFNAKAKIIVSKYNDESKLGGDFLTPEKVCDLFDELSETFVFKFDLAGYVPIVKGFDDQIESDVPVAASNMQMERAYSSILLRLLEGA